MQGSFAAQTGDQVESWDVDKSKKCCKKAIKSTIELTK
jgi:hypothetical protein